MDNELMVNSLREEARLIAERKPASSDLLRDAADRIEFLQDRIDIITAMLNLRYDLRSGIFNWANNMTIDESLIKNLYKKDGSET